MSYDDATAELEEQIKQQAAVIEQMREALQAMISAAVPKPAQCNCQQGQVCPVCDPDLVPAQAEKQEPVAFVHRNEAGQISMKAPDGGGFDISKFVGSSLYTRPQPDLKAEVERLRQICRDAYEVWAGSNGIPEPITCVEAYLLQLLIAMRDEVKRGLK